MKVIDDGIIKYDRSNFSHSEPLSLDEYKILEYWRRKLFEINLIGEYPEHQIGFGNVSMIFDYSKIYKSNKPQFIITGTQTGKYPHLDGNHYTRILDFSIDELKLNMQGVIEASSESITHAAIYEQNPLIKVVFHIHSSAIWSKMIEMNASHTDQNIPYGTLEMARATQKCVANQTFGAFCMRGHEDGVVAFGKTLEETWNIIIQLYEGRI